MNAGNIELWLLSFEREGAFHCSAVEVRNRDNAHVLHSWPLRVAEKQIVAARYPTSLLRCKAERAMDKAVQMYMSTTRGLLAAER